MPYIYICLFPPEMSYIYNKLKDILKNNLSYISTLYKSSNDPKIRKESKYIYMYYILCICTIYYIYVIYAP